MRKTKEKVHESAKLAVATAAKHEAVDDAKATPETELNGASGTENESSAATTAGVDACEVSFRWKPETGGMEMVMKGSCSAEDFKEVQAKVAELVQSSQVGNKALAGSVKDAEIDTKAMSGSEVKGDGEATEQANDDQNLGLDQISNDNQVDALQQLQAAEQSEIDTENLRKSEVKTTGDTKPSADQNENKKGKRRIVVEEIEPGKVRLIGSLGDLDLLDDDMVVEGIEENAP